MIGWSEWVTVYVCGSDWEVGEPIAAEITAPEEGLGFAVGAEVQCTANGSDSDYKDCGDTPCGGSASDDVTFTWSATRGSFPYGNTGPSVTWKAPSTPGLATVAVTVDDTGTTMYDDAEAQDSVEVLAVDLELTHVKFDYSSGDSTALAATVLTDTQANWTTNEFQGCELNPDITQATTSTVASNTATEITISSGDMTTVATAGDKYVVIFDDDALSIRENYTTDVELPEWVTGPTQAERNNPAAYMKQTPVAIWARFEVAPASVTSARIRATSPDSLGNLGEQTVSFSNGVSSPEYVRFTAASNTPNYVKKDTVTWTWKFRDINGSGSGDCDVSVGPGNSSGPHTIYTVLDRANEPWKEWGQRRIWTEVLDYICVWADHDAGEADAVEGITVGAYNGFGKDYDGSDSHARGTTLELTDLLADDWADCRDMSATVHVFVRGIGGEQTGVRIIDGPFHTKSIDPVGSPGWDDLDWHFHQVADYSDVYDACLMLDEDDARIPCGEDVDGVYKDDLYDYGTWDPETPFEYTTIE